MPRQARLDYPGALHHLILRGIERKRIFQDDQDRRDFLDRLGRLLTEASTPCYAWALLSNHVHLLLQTGRVPLATIMARLLTGYAVTYNRRHRRHGPLFQNRYKSILCQKDPYLLELVRYIHLNPLRARLVPDFDALEGYPYAGHSALLGKRKIPWQQDDSILGLFDRRLRVARRLYRRYVQEGIQAGRRPDLVGGGLKRSLRGWKEVQGEPQQRQKGDERILGNSDFVQAILQAAEEELDRTTRLRGQGIDLDELARRVARLFEVDQGHLWSRRKNSNLIQARSLLCYWAIHELGTTATAVAKRMGITQPAVSTASRRGEATAKEKGWRLEDL